MNTLTARQNMLEGQLRPNRIRNVNVLKAFADVPRERFLPPQFQDVAYADTPLTLEDGRVVFPPLVQAQMLQALDPQPGEEVLLIGALEGYLPALLLNIGMNLTVVEPCKIHARAGQNNLTDMWLVYAPWHVKMAEQGHAKNAPYRGIIINLPVAHVPESLFLQLQPGGQLVTVQENPSGVPQVMHYTRQNKTVLAEALAETQRIPIYAGFQPTQAFQF